MVDLFESILLQGEAQINNPQAVLNRPGLGGM
jgi:hypothetical protein